MDNEFLDQPGGAGTGDTSSDDEETRVTRAMCERSQNKLERTISGLLGKTSLPKLKVVESEDKGRGVLVDEDVEQGRYMFEYKADVYPRKERSAREREYIANGEGCYILDVLTSDGWMCLDATRKHVTVGRLLNHAPKATATLTPSKPIFIRDKWRVGFLAARDLSAGEELTWDYSCRADGIEWLRRRSSTRAGTQHTVKKTAPRAGPSASDFILSEAKEVAGTQHTVKKSGPRASPSASDFILSEAKEVAVKVGEGVSGERSDYSDGGDVSGDENSDVVVPSVGGPSTDESGEEEECGDRDTAAEDPIEPTAKGVSSQKVASFPPPSGGGEKVPSQVLREMFFGNRVAEAVNCAEWVSNTTAPSGPPKEQDGDPSVPGERVAEGSRRKRSKRRRRAVRRQAVGARQALPWSGCPEVEGVGRKVLRTSTRQKSRARCLARRRSRLRGKPSQESARSEELPEEEGRSVKQASTLQTDIETPKSCRDEDRLLPQRRRVITLPSSEDESSDFTSPSLSAETGGIKLVAKAQSIDSGLSGVCQSTSQTDVDTPKVLARRRRSRTLSSSEDEPSDFRNSSMKGESCDSGLGTQPRAPQKTSGVKSAGRYAKICPVPGCRSKPQKKLSQHISYKHPDLLHRKKELLAMARRYEDTIPKRRKTPLVCPSQPTLKEFVGSTPSSGGTEDGTAGVGSVRRTRAAR